MKDEFIKARDEWITAMTELHDKDGPTGKYDHRLEVTPPLDQSMLRQGADMAYSWLFKYSTEAYERFAQREYKALEKYHKEKMKNQKLQAENKKLREALEELCDLTDDTVILKREEND